MDTLFLDSEYDEIRQMIREFAQNEIAPIASKRDEEEYFDWDEYKKNGKCWPYRNTVA